MNPFVSVIIPTFNRAYCIERAVRCAQRQIGVEVEIIVVDDCSTDNTQEVLAELHKSDPRIHIVRHEKNQGVSAARNTGIAHAQGDFIAFLDSDDRWIYNKLRSQHDWLLNNARDIENAFCFTYFTNENSDGKASVYSMFVENTQQDASGRFVNPKHYTVDEIERGIVTFKLFGSLSTFFAHRKAVEKNGEFDTSMRYSQDNEYVIRFLLSGGKTIIMPEFQMIYARPDDDKVYPGQAAYPQKMVDKLTCAISRHYGASVAAAFAQFLRDEHRILAAPCDEWGAAAFALAPVSANAPCRSKACSLSGKTCQPVAARLDALQPVG